MAWLGLFSQLLPLHELCLRRGAGGVGGLRGAGGISGLGTWRSEVLRRWWGQEQRQVLRVWNGKVSGWGETGVSVRNFFPCGIPALEFVWGPQKFLHWSLSGALLLLCRGQMSPPCTWRSFPLSPLCHHLTSSSLGLVLCWSLVGKWIAVSLSTPERRSAPESGSLNPG